MWPPRQRKPVIGVRLCIWFAVDGVWVGEGWGTLCAFVCWSSVCVCPPKLRLQKKCHDSYYIITLQNIYISYVQAHRYFLIVYPIPQFGQITCFYLPSFPEMVQPSKLLSLRIGGGASFLIKTYLRSTMGTLKWYIGCLMLT